MIRELIELCREREHIFIQTHNNPDADAIASAAGLNRLLALNGISSVIRYVGRVDRVSTKRFVDFCHIEMQAFDGVYWETDTVILVDCQKTNGNLTLRGGNLLACIDHHPLESSGYPCSRIENAGACASLIADFYMELGLQFDAELATILLFGIKMDTLKFTRGITRLDISIFQELFDKTDSNKMRILETGDIALDDLKAFGSAIANIWVVADIGVSYVPFDCPDALIAVLSEFMLGIDELAITIVFSKRPGGIKLSVRTLLEFFDAGKFTARALEGIGTGGGHASFAGGFVPIENLKDIPESEYAHFLTSSFLKAYHELMIETDTL